MSDVAAMIRLMNHAADRLAEETPGVGLAFFHKLEAAATGGERANVLRSQASVIAAMTYAQTMLRMVAACMTEESAIDGATQVGGGE